MSTAELDLLPRRFGRYFLFDKIGEGGMARIYLGHEKSELGGERLVVVKQILPMLSDSAEFSRLLIEEAKLAAELTHGSIVQVFDLGRADGALYIAMEYVEGFDLRELLRRCTRGKVPLPLEFSLLVATETLRALDYAHRKKNEAGQALGVVHRDVSPSNILMSFEGEVKLCDFGIARAFGVPDQLPAETVQGKAGYMSPEAARGEPLDRRSDVFAVGVILWELVAGRRLYRGSSPATLDQAAAANIDALPIRGYPLEERLHAIIMRALAKDRDERYESAEAMLRDLEQYMADTRLLESPLRFGNWLLDHFGTDFVERRRARERAAKAVERGPLVELSVKRAADGFDGEAPEPQASEDPEPYPRTPAIRPVNLPPPPSEEDGAGPVVVPRIEPPPASLASSLQSRPRRDPPPVAKSESPPASSAGIPLWIPLLILAATALVAYWLR